VQPAYSVEQRRPVERFVAEEFMMKVRDLIVFTLLALLAPSVVSQVVINEIFYQAPDDLTDLQWIELFNNSDQPVDLAGWRLSSFVDRATEQGVPAPQ
jgi:hypothetical protein